MTFRFYGKARDWKSPDSTADIDSLAVHPIATRYLRWDGWTPAMTGMLLLGLANLFVIPCACAASRGYLSTIGPAPLRFETAPPKDSEDLALMKSYTPPLLNPDQGQESKPSQKINLAATLKTSKPTSPATSTNVSIQPSPHFNVHGKDKTVKVSSTPLIQTNKLEDAAGIASTQIASIESEEPPPAGAVFQPAPMSPQMLLHFFQSPTTMNDGSEAGAIIPMVFTPPQVAPPRSSKAVYQRSPN